DTLMLGEVADAEKQGGRALGPGAVGHLDRRGREHGAVDDAGVERGTGEQRTYLLCIEAGQVEAGGTGLDRGRADDAAVHVAAAAGGDHLGDLARRPRRYRVRV